VSRFIQSASAFVIKDTNARENILRIIVAKLDENAECAFRELSQLLDDEAGCPITYNHYYTDNVQKARNSRLRQDLGKSLNDTIEEWNGRFHVT
jgi:ATP-dependent 26S proteasome regulatory subunit